MIIVANACDAVREGEYEREKNEEEREANRRWLVWPAS